jgi:hypothetical protein
MECCEKKDNGLKISWSMGLYIRVSMKGNGRTTTEMEMEHISTKMEVSMKVSG